MTGGLGEMRGGVSVGDSYLESENILSGERMQSAERERLYASGVSDRELLLERVPLLRRGSLCVESERDRRGCGGDAVWKRRSIFGCLGERIVRTSDSFSDVTGPESMVRTLSSISSLRKERGLIGGWPGSSLS